MTPEVVPGALALCLVAGAAYTDLRYGKVRNAMTIPALGIGIIWGVATHGLTGLVSALGGIGIALALWVISSGCGRCMGGGDIKLLAAIGALCGAQFVLASLVIAVLVGGVMALIIAIRHGQLGATVRRCSAWIACRLGTRQALSLGGDGQGLRIPYALPIAAGVVACLLRPVGWGQ